MSIADWIPESQGAAIALFGGLSTVTVLLGGGMILGIVDQSTFVESAVRDIKRTVQIAAWAAIISLLGGFTLLRVLKETL